MYYTLALKEDIRKTIIDHHNQINSEMEVIKESINDLTKNGKKRLSESLEDFSTLQVFKRLYFFS